MSSEPQQPAPMLKPSDQRGDAHQSYLLRLWRSSGDGGWRASLQSVQTNERHMFADLESLLAFLVEQAQSRSVV
ncbi:hypothetical protein BH10CHL1_BH10CHL1_22280 [soil metagenome]